MNKNQTKPTSPKNTAAADDAMDRLCSRGFKAFRNGKILIPDNYELTSEDEADFAIVKETYRHSQLV